MIQNKYNPTENQLKYWNSLNGRKLSESHKINIRNTLIEGFKSGRIAKQNKFGEKSNRWKGGKTRNKICPDCGIEINYRSKRCKSCTYIYYKGKRAFNWKGGKTKKLKLIRNSQDYIEWREAVFIRDDYTCQKCFSKGKYLHAHHIKQLAFYPELAFDVNNGVTLCKDCHRESPVILRLKKEQFEVDTA